MAQSKPSTRSKRGLLSKESKTSQPMNSFPKASTLCLATWWEWCSVKRSRISLRSCQRTQKLNSSHAWGTRCLRTQIFFWLIVSIHLPICLSIRFHLLNSVLLSETKSIGGLRSSRTRSRAKTWRSQSLRNKLNQKMCKTWWRAKSKRLRVWWTR